MYRRLGSFLAISATIVGCTSVGNLGIVTRPSADTAAWLKSGVTLEELGSVEGSACRHFVIAVIPFGNASFSKAVEDALEKKGGDALLNVTVSNSLYGFIPIYNVYSFTCTSVQGMAVKIKPITAFSSADRLPDTIPLASQDIK